MGTTLKTKSIAIFIILLLSTLLGARIYTIQNPSVQEPAKTEKKYPKYNSMLQARPKRPNIETPKITASEPVAILKERLSAIAGLDDFHSQLERGMIAITLSKYLYAKGENQKAANYFHAIPGLEWREKAIQPFAVYLAHLIEQSDYEGAYALIKNSKSVHDKIMTISDIHEAFGLHPHKRNIHYDDPNRTPYDQISVNEALCKAGAQALIQNQQYQRLEKLLDIEQCHNNDFTVGVLITLRVSSLLKNGKYDAAQDLWIKYIDRIPDGDFWWKTIILEDYKKCIKGSPLDAGKKNILKKQKNEILVNFTDKKAVLLTTIFIHTQQYDDALELLHNFQDNELRKKLVRPIHEFYLAQDNQKKVKQIAEMINLKKAELSYIGGWGKKDKTQWHSSTSPEIKALASAPLVLAYNQLMSLENDKMRFMGLTYLHDKLSTKQKMQISSNISCEKPVRECIKNELEAITARQTDDFDKDLMRRKIYYHHIHNEQYDEAIKDLHEIIDPHRTVMTYDFGGPLMMGLGQEFMKRLDCENYIPRLPEYIRPKIVDGKNGKEIKHIDNLISCHIATGKYKAFIKTMSDFDPKTKQRYIFNLTSSLRNAGKIYEVLEVLYLAGKSNNAKDIESAIFMGLALNSVFREDPEKIKDSYEKRLEALDLHHAYSKNKDIWPHILIELIGNANFNPELLDILEPYYSKWPLLEKKWKHDPLFYSKICAYKNAKLPALPFTSTKNADGSITMEFLDNLPTGTKLIYPDTFTKVPDDQQAHIYNRCVRQWLLYEKMDKYDEAINFTKTMFSDPYYISKAAQDIVHEKSLDEIPAYKIGDKYKSWRKKRGECR